MDEPREPSKLNGWEMSGLFVASLILGPLAAAGGAFLGGADSKAGVIVLLLVGPIGLVSGPLGFLLGFGFARRVQDPQMRGMTALAVAALVSAAGPALYMGADHWPKQWKHTAILRRAEHDEAYLRDIIDRYGVRLESSEGIALSSACHKRNGIPADMVPVLLGKLKGQASSVAPVIRYQTVSSVLLWETFRQYSDDKWQNHDLWVALADNANTPEDLLVALTKVNDANVVYRANERLKTLQQDR